MKIIFQQLPGSLWQLVFYMIPYGDIMVFCAQNKWNMKQYFISFIYCISSIQNAEFIVKLQMAFSA